MEKKNDRKYNTENDTTIESRISEHILKSNQCDRSRDNGRNLRDFE